MRRLLLVSALLTLLLLGTGCEADNTSTEDAVPTASTAPGELAQLILVVPQGSATISETLVPLFESDRLPYRILMVEGTSDDAGVRGLEDGVIDIMILMRRPLPEEDIVFVELMRSPAIIFVNPDLGITNLTHDQVRGLYAGEITNWAQIGGADLPVKLYSHAEDASTTNLMRAHYGIDFPGDAEMIQNGYRLFSLVESVPGAIGFGSWPGKKYIELTSTEKLVDAVTLGGMRPDDPEYPLLSSVGLAYSPDREEYLRPFIDWTIGIVQSSAFPPVLEMFGIYPSPELNALTMDGS